LVAQKSIVHLPRLACGLEPWGAIQKNIEDTLSDFLAIMPFFGYFSLAAGDFSRRLKRYCINTLCRAEL